MGESNLDEGGWNIAQVTAWLIARDLEKVRRYANPANYTLDILYDGNGDSSPDRPQRTPEDDDTNWADRMAAYYAASNATQERVERPRKEAASQIIEALRTGKLYALMQDGSRISSDKWEIPGSLRAARNKAIFVPSREVLKLWPALGSTEAKIEKTISAETALARWLATEMRQSISGKKTKAEIRKNAEESGMPQVSNRSFERAWTKAVQESGKTKFSKAGRPPKSPQ